jgi:uncharacterized membrane protein YfcA
MFEVADLNGLGYPALVVLLGYAVFGMTGFGSALVIIPLLSWQWPLSAIVPTVLLLDIPASISHTAMNLKHVRWRMVPKVMPFAIFGAWLGSMAHPWGDSAWALTVLGLYICWVAARGLRSQDQRLATHSPMFNSMAGTLMGLIETLFGTAGPVVMAWLTRQERKIEDIRATAPLLILIMVCIALLGNGLSGRTDMEQVLVKTLWLAPVALLGGWIGHKCNLHIKPMAASKIIYAVLFASGMSLMARSILIGY